MGEEATLSFSLAPADVVRFSSTPRSHDRTDGCPGLYRMAEPVTDPANAIAPPERRRRQRGRCRSSWRASAIHHGTRAAEQCRRPSRRRPGDRGVRRRGAGLHGAGAEPDHRGGDRDGVAARGRCAPQFSRGDRRARPARPRIGGAGRPVRVSVKRAAQLRSDLRRVKGGAHGRGSDALKLVRIASHAEGGP